MKYFTLKELTRSETARVLKIKNEPTKEQEQNLTALVDNVLDPLRDVYGKPIIVNSGFRSKKLNEALNGSKTSQHVEGKAADITVGTLEGNKILHDWIMSLDLPFDQLIWEKGNDTGPAWVHVSYDKNRMRKQTLRIK